MDTPHARRNPQPERELQQLSLLPDYPADNLSQLQLGQRLKVNQSSVSRNRKKGRSHFREWSKELDPDGVAWDSSEELPTVFFKVKRVE